MIYVVMFLAHCLKAEELIKLIECKCQVLHTEMNSSWSKFHNTKNN